MFTLRNLLMASVAWNASMTGAVAQVSFGGMGGFATNASEVRERPFARENLTLDLAIAAAENGSQELSIEAFNRLLKHFPSNVQTVLPTAASGVQSSLLGTSINDPFGGQVSGVSSTRFSQGLQAPPSSLIPGMLRLVDAWKKANFDPAQVVKALRQAVLPVEKPNVVNCYVFGLRESADLQRSINTRMIGSSGLPPSASNPFAQPGSSSQQFPAGAGAISAIQRFRSPNINQALGLKLIDWAAQTGELDSVLLELAARSVHPEGQEAFPLMIYGERTAGRPDKAGEIVTRLLDEKKLLGSAWEMTVQAVMQPLAKDLDKQPGEDTVTGTATVTAQPGDLSSASQQIPLAIRERLLDNALLADLVAIAPYTQQLIRESIRTQNFQQLHRLVPAFIKQIESMASGMPGRTNVANTVWNEVVSECFRQNQPYMALKALRLIQESSAAQSLPSPPTRDELRMRALLSLCEQPLDKRQAIANWLIFDEPLATPEVFCFASFPDSPAPAYFRTPQWQTASKLLQADPEVRTISLLDLLLSDAETSGKLEETLQKLLDRLQAEAKSPLYFRLLCEWIALRAEVRQQSLPPRVADGLAASIDQAAFEKWYTAAEASIRQALVARSRRHSAGPVAKFILESEANPFTPDSDQAAGRGVTWSSTNPLKHWLAFPVPEPPNSQANAGYGFPPRPWQISDQQVLRSPGTSLALLFKYPLKGDYSIRFKIQKSGEDWSNNCYGSIIHGAFLEYRGLTQTGAREILPSINSRLTSSLNSSLRLNEKMGKTETVNVECAHHGKQFTLTINGNKLAHTEFTSDSFPFVGLLPMRMPAEQSSVEFVGNPEIATTVNLIDNAFSGWSARRYDRLLTNVIQLRPVNQPLPVEEPSPSHLASWKIENNELRSEGSFAATNTNDPQVLLRKTHNCMLYARPLLEGERFEYEVWVDQQTPPVSPVLGLTAYLFEEGQVRLHWLPTAKELQACGITMDNRGDDPQAEQLSHARWIENQWNKVSLRVANNQIILNHNGTDIYRRPIPAGAPLEFGWLSVPDEPSVRVRQATLTGNWPTQLPSNLWELLP